MKFVFLILLISSCSLSKKLGKDSKEKKTDKEELRDLNYFSIETVLNEQLIGETNKILSSLSSDEFEGRKPGGKGFELCVEYIESYLRKSNISPFFGNSYKDSLVSKGVETYNIVGLIGEKSDKEYVLIGAHFDHLGKSKSKRDSVFNGANDNASGVTAVLQISEQFAKYKFNQPIIIALFTAEEDYLVGSKHLAKRLKDAGIKLSNVFNFEMIGKTLSTGENQVYITGYNKSNLAKEMNRVIGKKFVNFLQAEISYQLFSRSDNFPFYAEFKVPSHTISTFDFKNYNHYHKVSDEIGELDIENMHAIINSSTFIIGELLKNNVILISNQK